MKNLTLIASFLLVSVCCFADTHTWTGGTSSNLNTASNWTGGLPSNDDDLIIDADNYSGNFAPIITANLNFDPDDITIRDGGTLEMSGGSLNIDDITVLTGGTLDLSGGSLDINNLFLDAGNFIQTGGTFEVDEELELDTGVNNVSVSGGQFDLSNDFEIYSDNNNISFSGTADVNISENFDFHSAEGNTINVSGTATVDIGDEIEFTDTTTNIFFISGNSRVTVPVGTDGNEEDDADDFFTVNEPGYLDLGGEIRLPVDLIEFKGELEESSVVLNWSTASEKNNDYFEVLKSIDGVTFSPVSKITGNGTSNSVNYYDYTDRHPKYGINYYQLRQVDYDGQNESFSVISVIYGASEEAARHMAVWPNPVTEKRFNISVDNFKISGTPKVSLIDMQGRVLLLEPFSSGSNSMSIDISNTRINVGISILEYHNGLESIRKRIVIN